MARLPHSCTRLEGREINVRGDRAPVRFSHPIREIEDYMDDIVMNAISIIQEKSRDGDLRTFYFNMMSDHDYDNQDFEDLIGMIADVIDIAVSDGTFREVRDAVMRCCEDVVDLHTAWQCEKYRELMDGLSNGQRRDAEKAIDLYENYMRAVDVYRKNGNKVPSSRDRQARGRGRDRDDDRDDRGGRSRGGRTRRDEWDRGAVRDGVHGTRRGGRTAAKGGRGSGYDDDVIVDPTQLDSGYSNTDTRRDEPAPRSRIQRIPYVKPVSDIDDALDRENQTPNKGSSVNRIENIHDLENASQAPLHGPMLLAKDNPDAWLPTEANPHPPTINSNQDLMWEIDTKNACIIPRVVAKETSVNFYEHNSMAFGTQSSSLERYDNGDVVNHLNRAHEALLQPIVKVKVEGEEDRDELVRLDLQEMKTMPSPAEAFTHLNFQAAVSKKESKYPATREVDIVTMGTYITRSFIVPEEELQVLEEMRNITTFTKLAEKMRFNAPRMRPESFVRFNRYITECVNRMLKQCLSIESLSITDFVNDWLDLFDAITKNYGDGFRDAINTHQQKELSGILAYHATAENEVTARLNQFLPTTEGAAEAKRIGRVKPFVVTVPTKLINVSILSNRMDLDMFPGVASQLMPESNPFFHDLAQDVLTKNADKFARFFLESADGRVMELSRSWMNDKALLIRLIN